MHEFGSVIDSGFSDDAETGRESGDLLGREDKLGRDVKKRTSDSVDTLEL